MGAPSPELCNLWLARAFNAQDVEAAAAMYHPEASIVQVDQVHGGTKTARGAAGIRGTMAAYIGMRPHMDVLTHHTTVAGDFAMTRSQWLIKGRDGTASRSRCTIMAWRCIAGCRTVPGCSSSTTRSGPIPPGASRRHRERNSETVHPTLLAAEHRLDDVGSTRRPSSLIGQDMR